MPEGPIILFDGECNLCDRSVRFILARDRKQQFRFASLQSAAGTRLIERFAPRAQGSTTVVLIADGTAHIRSDAALRIAARMDGLWPVLGVFRIVPRPLRDWVYDVVARNRYRWFGRTPCCMVPSPELRERFLS